MKDQIIKDVYNFVKKKVEKGNLNKYVKIHSMEKMTLLLLYYQTQKIKYGRSFIKMLGMHLDNMKKSISQSEFSKKLTKKIPLSLWKSLYEFVLEKTASQSQNKSNILSKLRIIDSSALESSLSMDWAKHRKTKNGLKLHLLIDSNLAPIGFRLKNGCSSDKKSLKWAVKPDFIYVFDRGYNDFKLFSWISEKKAFFVTRAYKNLCYEVISNKKIGSKQKKEGIKSDQIIKVLFNRKSKETINFRMIKYSFTDSNDKEQNFSFITDILDMKSDEIAKIYRERWSIEVVFRWIKMYLNISHWYSRSKNGVFIQFYSALITYMLIFYLSHKYKKYSHVMRDYSHYIAALLFTWIKIYKLNCCYQ
jgi:hypothetical protein